ncbi:DUF5615 family PIN-like protein [Magnetospirillum sp. UT-4]|uniref:DUF5615 family PIN-like protein n=1 Tax=Magnetospirillum sp. UT-4 TaxID=2681467 RepID=UPI001383EF6E|nr:DUF5615 family PIN-like protein [Magnetospirillum sp. UT-4]CAA7619382.1 conserved hypothetical protein [Magnetospirillum sp. UT-4]
MTATRLRLSLVLDEGVPVSVGKAFQEAGHEVHWFNDVFTKGAPDPLVATVAQLNEWVLIALDGDMKQLAKSAGIGHRSFSKLSLIKLSCDETVAAARVRVCMSLIEHEWHNGVTNGADRCLFLEIGNSWIRSNR